jgi:hypothetical protein
MLETHPHPVPPLEREGTWGAAVALEREATQCHLRCLYAMRLSLTLCGFPKGKSPLSPLRKGGDAGALAEVIVGCFALLARFYGRRYKSWSDETKIPPVPPSQRGGR